MTNFMRFWKSMNELLASRNLPEIGYGEARGLFDYSGIGA